MHQDVLHAQGVKLVRLRAKLKARTGADGKPKPGYEKNCEEIAKRIAVIEQSTLMASKG